MIGSWQTRFLAILGALTLAPLTQLAAQAPDADIYLAELSLRAGRPVIGEARNITRRVGYDNQPHFTTDNRAILYTVIDSAGQADIWRYDIASGRSVQVTKTAPESEYSATPLRGGGFSVIRVERDSTQRLWKFDDSGGNARVVIEDVRPVGYHAWVSDDVVALFVLGSPATLQVANLRSGEVKTHTSDIGRSLQTVPGRRTVSFVQRTNVNDTTRWLLRELDPATGAVVTIASAPEQIPASGGRAIMADFHAWTPDGVLLTSLGNRILGWDATARTWYTVADYAEQGLVVTRLAVSPKGDRIAFVAQATARE